MSIDLLRDRFPVRGFVLRILALLATLLAVSGNSLAGQVSLAWDAVANATGYKVHYGQSSSSYSANLDANNQLSYTVPALTDGARYYFAVTAYGPAGTAESTFSNEVTTVISTSSAPAASFTASPTTGTAPLTVTLTDTSTGSITSRSWNLGDGTTATSQTVAKTYSTPGTYTVTLTVTGAGGSTTASRTITAAAAAPAASFSASPLTGTAPVTVNFTDTSTGTVTAWSWNFGDGGTSTAKNPSRSYATPGTYTVSLTVTGPAGSNQTTKTGYIIVSPAGGGGGTGGNPGNTKGLVAAYGFEEASGTQVIDASGNTNHGAISGASRVTTNQFGKALMFDGTNDWVTVNDSASLDLTTGMTLEAWVYPTVWINGWDTVLLKEQPTGLTYSLYANSDVGRPSNTVNAGGADRQLSVGSHLPTNTWTHLVATYNGSTQQLYVNGVLAGSRPQSGPMTVSGGALRIGGNAVWGEYFTGYIDEVRIYNRALTQAEISADSKTSVVGLVMSKSADRSNAVPLNGAPVSGNIYVYYALISPTAGSKPAKQVEFWLDDATPTNPTGTPRLTDSAGPFDFAGTAQDGTALPFDTAGLSKGVHTITAQVTLSDGTVLPFVTGTFTIP